MIEQLWGVCKSHTVIASGLPSSLLAHGFLKHVPTSAASWSFSSWVQAHHRPTFVPWATGLAAAWVHQEHITNSSTGKPPWKSNTVDLPTYCPYTHDWGRSSQLASPACGGERCSVSGLLCLQPILQTRPLPLLFSFVRCCESDSNCDTIMTFQ